MTQSEPHPRGGDDDEREREREREGRERGKKCVEPEEGLMADAGDEAVVSTCREAAHRGDWTLALRAARACLQQHRRLYYLRCFEGLALAKGHPQRSTAAGLLPRQPGHWEEPSDHLD